MDLYPYDICVKKLSGTCAKKIIRRGHSMPVPLTSTSISCNNYELKARAGTIFRNCKKSNIMGTPRKGDKSAIQNNSHF